MMFLERVYDHDLAQASYVIGCQAHSEAVVVDPRRDVDVYLELAATHGMRIVAVTETHIHADYLSGTRELAARTGARMYVSGEGGREWQYGAGFRDAARLHHDDTITLGNVTLRAVHTPGHTPEHLMFLVTDGVTADTPGFALTGDFVFVGDLGRPDLLDEAAGGVDSRFDGARDLYASLRDRFLSLPDYVQVLPGHGSGSACGKALGAIASSTVGYERQFSWWAPYLANGNEQGFVDALLYGQPDAHAYFARMKSENKRGPALLNGYREPELYDAERLSRELSEDRVIFVDTRTHREVHGGTVPRSLNIPGAAKAASYGAWVYDPVVESRPLVVLAQTRQAVQELHDHLVRVGVDRVAGYVSSLDGLDLVKPRVLAAEALNSFEHIGVIDVRSRAEFAAGHLPGATHVSGGRALWQRHSLPSGVNGALVSYCQSGVRNSVVASALRRAGHDVVELEGSYVAWAAVPGNVPICG